MRARSQAVLVSLMACVGACKGVVVSAFPEQFVGVGLELTLRDGGPTVVRALDGGSAAEAGLTRDDQIVAINDIPTAGLALPDIVLKLRGEEGSTVTVTVQRNDLQIKRVLVRHGLEKRGDGYVARGQGS